MAAPRLGIPASPFDGFAVSLFGGGAEKPEGFTPPES
jgi:hypothetical protein